MKITVAAVGKVKEKYLRDGIAEYAKRLSRFCDLEIIEVEDEQAPEKLSFAQEVQLKQKEAEKLLKRIKSNSVLIALDVKGQKVDSEQFARQIETLALTGSSHLTFIIGGSLGIDEELIQKCRLNISMSDMTFPHQLARLILMEQLYRAFKIINGEVYHK